MIHLCLGQLQSKGNSTGTDFLKTLTALTNRINGDSRVDPGNNHEDIVRWDLPISVLNLSEIVIKPFILFQTFL